MRDLSLVRIFNNIKILSRHTKAKNDILQNLAKQNALNINKQEHT